MPTDNPFGLDFSLGTTSEVTTPDGQTKVMPVAAPRDAADTDKGTNPYREPAKTFDTNTTGLPSAAQVANKSFGEGSFADSVNDENGADAIDRGAHTRASSSGFNDNFQYAPENVAIDNPFADYNNLSWEQTKQLSRLADAFNNSKRWTPGQMVDGKIVQHSGAQDRKPIETEETRRMDTSRQALAKQTDQALDRANTTLMYPQKLTEMLDSAGLEANKAQLEMRRHWADYAAMAQYNAEFAKPWEDAVQRSYDKYIHDLAKWEGSDTAITLYNLQRTDPMLSTWIGGEIAKCTNPSMEQYLAGLVARQLLNDNPNLKNGDYHALLSELLDTFNGLTALAEYANTQSVIKSAKAGAAGTISR